MICPTLASFVFLSSLLYLSTIAVVPSLSALFVPMCTSVMYVYAMATNFPTWFLVHFVDGHCLQETSLPIDIHMKVLYWFSIYWFFVVTLLPVAMLSVLYGRIVLKLRRHLITVASVSQSQAISKSTVRITKCAFTVTVVFIATTSYHSVYLCIASLGLVSWDFRGPVQLFGMMLVVVNSFANPFIYMVYMPSFR